MLARIAQAPSFGARQISVTLSVLDVQSLARSSTGRGNSQCRARNGEGSRFLHEPALILNGLQATDREGSRLLPSTHFYHRLSRLFLAGVQAGHQLVPDNTILIGEGLTDTPNRNGDPAGGHRRVSVRRPCGCSGNRCIVRHCGHRLDHRRVAGPAFAQEETLAFKLKRDDLGAYPDALAEAPGTARPA